VLIDPTNSDTKQSPHRGFLFLAGVLFTLSGALGLGYQLVWIRKAALIVGSSQIALSTVLASFFLGIALGSKITGGRFKSRRFSPLFIYGLFEGAIGAYALAFPVLFEFIESLYAAAYPAAAGSAEALFFLRFVLLFFLFIIPTFFMGGTLPLLLDGLVEKNAGIGSLTGLLYGLNIAGAVIGVLITGYFAIPHLGMNGTNFAAGIGNLTIAASALVFFRKTAPIHIPPSTGYHPRGPGVFFCVLAVLSGFAAIGYQVAWARYFSLFKTASVYLTAVLLAVYLSALAAGSLAMSRLLKAGVRPLRVVALLQPIAVLLIFFGLAWWRFADYSLSAADFDIEPTWRFVSETADTIFFAPLFQVGLVIFLPVTLLGTALPGIIAAATRKSRELRASSGRLVFWNTIGASAGGFAAGYLLIPAFGLTGAFFSLSILSLALGAAAGGWKTRYNFRHNSKNSAGQADGAAKRFSWSLPHALSIFTLIVAISFLRNDITRKTVLTYGVGKRLGGTELIDIIEGPLTTGSIFANSKNLYIASNDQILAVARKDDISVQAVEGHLPALFYPRPGTPKRVLGIAVGSGQSFGAMLRYPIEHMDIVDISTEMIELAFKHFKEYNFDLGGDSRVAVHLDDGRHFIERAKSGSYDVISMEPPPPTAPGVHTLYSMEFYLAARRVLREDGVLMQWVPLYWLTPNEARGLVKTVVEVFPQTFIVRMGQIDFVTLSFKRETPPLFSLEWIKERAKTFAKEKEVSGRRWTSKCRYGTASIEGILALLAAGPEDVAHMKSPYIYKDDDLRLSYSSGDRRLLRRYHKTILPIITFPALPHTPFADLRRYFKEAIPAADIAEERARALALYHVPSPADIAEAKKIYTTADDPSIRAQSALNAAKLSAFDFEASSEWIFRSIKSDPSLQANWIKNWIRYHVHLHAEDLRRRLDTLPAGYLQSSLVKEIEKGLKQYDKSQIIRRSRYFMNRLVSALPGFKRADGE